MVFQSLNIFKSSAHAVIPAGDAFDASAPLRVATPEAEAAMVKRGTVENLKTVKGPTREELEADFAFITSVLSKAGPSAAPLQRRQAATRIIEQPKTKVYQTKAPTYVPHHKRGNPANGNKPVFAVQDQPRSAQPDFLRAALVEPQEDDDEPVVEDAISTEDDYDVEAFWGASDAPDDDPQAAKDIPQEVEVQADVSASTAVEKPTSTEPAGDGAKLLEAVPVDDVSAALATAMCEAEAERTATVGATGRQMGFFRRLVSVRPLENMVEMTDPYHFGPELPKVLCRALNRFWKAAGVESETQTS